MVSIYSSAQFVSFQVQDNGTGRSVSGKDIAGVYAQFSNHDKSLIVAVATEILMASKSEQESSKVLDDILLLLGVK